MGPTWRLMQAEKMDGAFDLDAVREVLPNMELREVRPETLACRRASLKTQIQRWLEEWHRFPSMVNRGEGRANGHPYRKTLAVKPPTNDHRPTPAHPAEGPAFLPPPSCHILSRKGRTCVTELGIDRYRLLY